MSPCTTALLALVEANDRVYEYITNNGNDGSDALVQLKAGREAAASDYEAKLMDFIHSA